MPSLSAAHASGTTRTRS